MCLRGALEMPQMCHTGEVLQEWLEGTSGGHLERILGAPWSCLRGVLGVPGCQRGALQVPQRCREVPKMVWLWQFGSMVWLWWWCRVVWLPQFCDIVWLQQSCSKVWLCYSCSMVRLQQQQSVA